MQRALNNRGVRLDGEAERTRRERELAAGVAEHQGAAERGEPRRQRGAGLLGRQPAEIDPADVNAVSDHVAVAAVVGEGGAGPGARDDEHDQDHDRNPSGKEAAGPAPGVTSGAHPRCLYRARRLAERRKGR